MQTCTDMRNSDRTTLRLMRGIAHIERALEEDICLSDVAASTALSDFHFHRLFRARFGMPVMDYVRRRRLTEAAGALLRSRTPILHIALNAGFQSQAAFTRAFCKVYRTSPARFRARGHEVPWLSAAPLSAAVLTLLPGLGKDQPTLEIRDVVVVEGIEETFDGPGRTGIPELWRRLERQVGSSRFAGEERFGISAGGEEVLGGVLPYMAGVRLEPGHPVTAGLKAGLIAGGPYLRFTVHGDHRNVPTAYDFIYGIWLPGSRHVLRLSPSFAMFPPAHGNRRTPGIQIWIPVEPA